MVNFLAGLAIVTIIAGPSGMIAYLLASAAIVAVLLAIAVLPWLNDKLLKLL